MAHLAWEQNVAVVKSCKLLGCKLAWHGCMWSHMVCLCVCCHSCEHWALQKWLNQSRYHLGGGQTHVGPRNDVLDGGGGILAPAGEYCRSVCACSSDVVWCCHYCSNLFVVNVSVHCFCRTKPIDRQRRSCLHKGDDDVSCGHSALPFTNHCLRRILQLLFISKFYLFSETVFRALYIYI